MINGNSPAIELLKNVNNEFSKKSISVTIKRIFTDVNGAILLGGAIPAAMRLAYPFYLLGEFDKTSGYKIGNRITPPPAAAKYLTTFVNGSPLTTASIIGFNALNNVQNEITIGDLVHVFVDDLSVPNTFVWVIQQNLDVSLAAVVSNTSSADKSDKFSRLFVEEILYSTTNNNPAQWSQPISKVRMDSLGSSESDNISAQVFRTPQTSLDNIVKIKGDVARFKIDQYIGIYSYILFTTDQIKIVFNLIK